MNTIDILKAEFKKRLFEESSTRIQKVLSELTDEQIWYTPNNNSNSIGNLILHLCGNVTQWIGNGIGKLPDTRYRAEEFTKLNVPRHELVEGLVQLELLTMPIIEKLKESDLTQEEVVQGFDETTLSILIHVIEHFSYHTGQIAYIAKMLIDRDLGFYEGLDLNIKGKP
jgi:uncharacterized damage-inducible protein DinB